MHWLKNKKQQISFFVSCLFVLLILFTLSYYNLNSIWKNIYVSSLFLFSISSLFSFIFIFINFYIWKIWLKYISIISIIGFLLLLGSSNTDGDFGPTSQIVFGFIFTILYSLISLGIIIYHSFKK